jgi:CDP-glucose 4,6-dehydratase
MLKILGHEVHGISLNPLKNGIFELASIGEICSSNTILDIRKKAELDAEILRIQPEFIFHLAAQALVLTSYENVYETYSTNVLGTLNILDSSLRSEILKGMIVVTTDKVYANDETKVFVETHLLGGQDPYSSSKALADRLTQDWAIQNNSIPIGIARAGNVIGGGDVSSSRLIPDILLAISENRVPMIRNPKSIRPWQHVLDCLSGYLKLMDYVASGKSGAFNFGPAAKDYYPVEAVVNYVSKHLKVEELDIRSTGDKREATFLALDSSKALIELGWKSKLSFEESIDLTLDWYSNLTSSVEKRVVSIKQIEYFFNI